jgi:ParB family chromosome partitioning protein
LKKTTLGRGLDALIPKETAQPGARAGYIVAGIGEIRPNRSQPRKDFDDASISELTSSIREKGIIQPLVVRQTGSGYEIIAGERRWRAAQKAGLAKIPVIVKEATDREMLELALIENLQREDLNPIEEAAAYSQLIEDFGLTHEDVSNRIGKERSTITNQLRLLRLFQDARQALIEGEITAGHARALLSIESEDKSRQILIAIRKQKLSVRATENLIKKLSKEKKETPEPGGYDPYLKQITDELKRTLSTQVRIVNKKGKGKIEIEYYSQDELERVSRILLGDK